MSKKTTKAPVETPVETTTANERDLSTFKEGMKGIGRVIGRKAQATLAGAPLMLIKETALIANEVAPPWHLAPLVTGSLTNLREAMTKTRRRGEDDALKLSQQAADIAKRPIQSVTDSVKNGWSKVIGSNQAKTENVTIDATVEPSDSRRTAQA